MARVMAAIAVLVLVCGSPARSAELQLPGLDADAHSYLSALTAKSPPAPNPALIAAGTAEAAQAETAHDAARAVQALERAIAARDDSAPTWMALARARSELTPPDLSRALQAGWLAVTKAPPGRERLDDILWLARLLEGPLNRPRQALVAYRAAVAEAREAKIAEPEAARRVDALRMAVGLTVAKVEVHRDESPARACVTFSDPLKTGRDIHFEDFVRLEPAVRLSAIAEGDELCLSGLAHGTGYSLTLRQGLPGADGMTLRQDETSRLQVEDRPPSVAFRGQAFILARGDAGGLPVVTVNLDAVDLQLLRINDRNLASQLRGDALRNALSDYDIRHLARSEAELVWQGRMAVKGGRNQEGVTPLAIRSLIPDPRPGLYVVTASPADVAWQIKPWTLATQWLMITDLGLTTTRGADGVNVFVRALSTAKPLAGVAVTLVARNNAELGRAVTDADGHARFPAGLTRGTGGQGPLLVTAAKGDDDFAFLDLALAAFDLSDRGVGGRAAPGPLDAYVYSDRGVYRPGETVNLTALLRDDKTAAVETMPLTVKVLRPGGTEFYAGTLKAAPAGGFTLPLALSATAPFGTWTVNVYGDPKANPIGHVTFLVDSFVPERLAVTLAASGPAIVPGQPFAVDVASRFLYGPPAAGLGGTADVSLEVDPDPYPRLPGFRFGLVQEEVTARLGELVLPPGDAAGKARLAVELPAVPDTTRPLRATIRVGVAEPGGRPTRQSLSVPVRIQPYAIGLKARFDPGRLGEAESARFEVVAVAPDGQRVAKPELRWRLVAEMRDFQWYMEEGSYKYRVTEHDRPLRAGTLAVATTGPAALEMGTLPWGRYRLEVQDAAGVVASSLRFTSGWDEGPQSADTPDTVTVTADKPAYVAGDTAHVHIDPPFDGEVLLTVATDRIVAVRTLSVPKGGTTVDVPASADWGPGAYVTATVYRPPVHGKEHRLVRAIGLAWLPLDAAARTLGVGLALPEVIRPHQSLEVPITVTSSSSGSDTYVTLAAVDEGILQLTHFDSPAPGAYFFGKRALGLDIRDDYGRLIETVDGPPGALREGGDKGGLAGGLPKVPITVVSLFRGPVKVGADGKALVKLDIPDFNGQLRLMAVAFGKVGVGSADAKITVRDALVAELATPRFLAPGDDSRVTVSLDNVEAPAGRYRVAVAGEGPVRVADGERTVSLGKGERQTLTLPLGADTAGSGGVALTVSGPEDGPATVAIHQELGLTVRPSRPEETLFTVKSLPPGGVAVADAGLLAGYVPGTVGVSLGFSAAPPFDVAGLLAALDRYPYGCLEQVVSRALPLLAVNDMALALGAARKPDDNLAARIDQAIARVLDKQRFDGAFGVWGASGEAAPWLTAYALEFLTRARSAGHTVPEAPYLAGLTWLRQQAIDGGTDAPALASRAYAFHTLALAGQLTAGPVRYFADAFGGNLPTPLAKGQLGAALARLGDRDRAETAFAAAFSQLGREPWEEDYGSTVRDAAALVSLATEAGVLDKSRLAVLLDRLPTSATAVADTSTQEQAWLVLAAGSLMKGAAPLSLSLGDQPLGAADPVRLEPTAAQLEAGLAIRNTGRAPVWQTLSVHGVPAAARPAVHEGFKIRRYFFRRDGSPLDLDHIRQNDVFVVVLEGEATAKVRHQAILTQPLPAGWEIENKALGAGGTEGLGWLADLSQPAVAEARDDRYVAAIALAEDKPKVKLAFLVRAVTPGSYELPGAEIADMYHPRLIARQAAGRITVQP